MVFVILHLMVTFAAVIDLGAVMLIIGNGAAVNVVELELHKDIKKDDMMYTDIDVASTMSSNSESRMYWLLGLNNSNL